MKGICWKFFKARVKAHKTQQKPLEKELETLLSFSSTEDTIEQISEISEKLCTIHRQQVTSVKIRSNDRFYDDNEKPTEYFFSLENSRQSQKNITKLIDDDGDVYTGKTKSLTILLDFTPNYTQKNQVMHIRNKNFWTAFTDVCQPM